MLASFDGGGTVRLFAVDSGNVLRTLHAGNYTSHGLAFSPDGEIVAASTGPTIYLWNPKTGELIRRLEGHKDWLLALTFSSDGKKLASHARDKMTKVWDVAGGKLVQEFEDYHDGSASLAFAPGDKTLASTGHNGTVHLWDWAKGKKTAEYAPNRRFSVAKVLFSPEGDLVITAGEQDGLIRYWHIGQAREVRNFLAHKGGVNGLAMSKDGKTLEIGRAHV